MGVFELGTDDRLAGVYNAAESEQRRAARRDDYAVQRGNARRPTPRGASSVQIHRRLSAATNRSAPDDQLGGFLSNIGKAVSKAAGQVVKVAAPVAKIGVNLIPGGGAIKTIASAALNLKKPAAPPPPPPPPPVRAARPARPALPPPPAVRPKPTSVALARPVKVAPDAVVKAGVAKPVVMTKQESGLVAQLKGLVSAATTAKDAHDAGQKAKGLSQTLKDRARRLSGNAAAIAKKAEQAAAAGDAVGAAGFAQQARAIAAVANNTAVAANDAGNYVERAGNAVAAGVDAGIAAGAANSEGFGGFVAKLQANPALALAGVAALAGVGYIAFRPKRRRAA